jgi:16S rRNA (uracil1498-N3)-methyltransferase
MQIFYCREISHGKALFTREESRHCLKVLRMREGEEITFTDGHGNLYQGVINEADPSAMSATVTSVIHDYGKRGYRLHIAISPLKNDDRLEWFIEKAVETGIDEITPLLCARTEKSRIRRERLESLILSAMKQSVKSYLPRLNNPVRFIDFIAGVYAGKRIIASCDPAIERMTVTSSFGRGDDVVIMIGPEGDFTLEEVTAALQAGFQPVHIGPSRLRTETAGVVACCSVYLSNL